MDPTRTAPLPFEGSTEAGYDDLLRDLGRAAGGFRFETAPNPCVGAAVLSGGVEIARGFHERWGGPHAEVNALAAATTSGIAREDWDTLIVTLEPCSSSGKTPPCVDAILDHGIRRVVVGALDPDPRHRGAGLAKLHEAGVEVILRAGCTPLEEVSPHFLRWILPERIRRPRPWTIAKWAQTRTGQLSPPEDVGEGRWISGTAAREDVQVLRSRVDAIVTGIGTVLADDPRLTIRAPADIENPPLRVVLDSTLSTPPTATLFAEPGAGAAGGTVHVFTRRGADALRRRTLEERGAVIHGIRPGDDGRPSLREALTVLWSLGVRRLLLEAGPDLLESWFTVEYVDQLAVYTGNVNGGRGSSMGHRLQLEALRQVQHGEVGEDALLQAFLA